MATTGGRTTRRRSRGDTLTEDEANREKDMPATKRRREDKKPSATGTSFGTGRAVNVPTVPKKLKPAYEEEDDGFAFTRKSRATTRSAKVAVPNPPLKEPTLPSVLTPPRQAKVRDSKAKPVAAKYQEHPPRQFLQQPLSVPKTWGFEQSMEDAGLDPISPPPPASPVRRGRRTSSEGAKVVIPLSDTPIIQRNKQFRKEAGGGAGRSSRRSSLGLRGRRASSLIDNGQVAEPHPELSPEEFYKHIDAELVEPRRMKQLLVWCAKRATTPLPPNKLGGDGNAHAIARIIQEEIMKNLLEKSELSNWFKREEQPSTTIVKKPNPRNVDNLAKAQECEATLQRLKEEHRSWELLTKKAESGGTLPIPKPLPNPPIPAAFRLKLQPSQPRSPSSETVPTLAEPSQDMLLLTHREDTFITNTLSTLSSTVASTTTLLNSAQSNLELNVDLLDDGLHQLAQLNKSAEELAGELLKDAEETLRKRDVQIKKETGTEGLGLREVLRSITRLDV
ncbi:Mis12-Mtw1 protein family-domain-containing protein [Terfezia claveryi]|nr:Mis12-Mtw1 protein family-domain-containing protein [Terfezia claveryi]